MIALIRVEPYNRANHLGRVSDLCSYCSMPALFSVWMPAPVGARGITRRLAVCGKHAPQDEPGEQEVSELDVARETNRRLNRRIQELEHKLRLAEGRANELIHHCPYRAELERLKEQT